jgi:hypothetical protein
MADRTDDKATKGRQDGANAIELAREAKSALTSIHNQLSTDWAADDRRVVGHVIFSPPIAFGVGTGQYTRDMAVIAVDASKIDLASFGGNVIDVGFKICPKS